MKIVSCMSWNRNNLPVRTVIASALAVAWVFLGSAARGQEAELPPMEEHTLVTSDSVKLFVNYLPGTHGKETVPVIMLHSWDADKDIALRELQLFTARYLQRNYGFAVLIPDLRGHGKSTEIENSTETIDKSHWRGAQLAVLIEDIEACKRFLIQKNDAGELNIDLLSLIAEKESSIHAVLWTLRDWSFLPVSGRKQGQDVKSIVMIDPVRSFNGLNGNDAYRNKMFTGGVGAGFPIMIATNKFEKGDGEALYGSLERSRKRLDTKDQHLQLTEYFVEKQQQIVRQRGTHDKYLAQLIGDFLTTEVYDRKHDFRWNERLPK